MAKLTDHSEAEWCRASVARRYVRDTETFDELCDDVKAGDMTEDEAAECWLSWAAGFSGWTARLIWKKLGVRVKGVG